MKQQAYESSAAVFNPELARLQQQIHYQDSLIGASNAGRQQRDLQYENQVTNDVGFLERNKALSDLSGHESSVFWSSLLLSLLIILIETGPILSKLIMNTGPYDVALASFELRQMAAAEDEMRRDKELRHSKKQNIYGRKKEMTEQVLQKLSGLQKKHVQEELDQWEKGEEKAAPRVPLDELAKRIKDRYDFREDDVL
jgi:hypothetical protein